MINFDQINKSLFVGSYPQNVVDIDRLRDGPEITAIVNLQSDDDIKSLRIDWSTLESYYIKRDMVVVRVPILDFNPDDLKREIRTAVEQVGKLESVGHRIYIHCTAGVGRAPAVAIGHLAWNHGWDLDDAYEFVRQARACDPYINAIRAAD